MDKVIYDAISSIQNLISHTKELLVKITKYVLGILHYYLGWPALTPSVILAVPEEIRWKHFHIFYSDYSWHNVIYNEKLLSQAKFLYRFVLAH